MNLKIKIGIALTSLTLIFFIFNCSNDSPTAGGGNSSGVGNALVYGHLYYEDGTPAAGAKVRFVTVNHDPRSTAVLDSALTNDMGYYGLNDLPEGIYNVFGLGKNGSVSYRDSLYIVTDTINVGSDTLGVPGILRGVVKLDPPADSGYVFIILLGTNTYAMADMGGNFTLHGLAKGEYHALVLTTTPDYNQVDTLFTISPGVSTVLSDTIYLTYKGIPKVTGLSISYDTMMQVVTLSWDRIDQADIKGYNVYRKHSDSSFVKVNTAYITDTVYKDGSAIQWEAYTYKITAIDQGDNGGLKSDGKDVVIESAVKFVKEFGEEMLGGCHQMHIDNKGKLYVCADHPSKIVVFDTSGAYLFEFGEDTLNLPIDVATDNNGYIYIADQRLQAILKFDSLGNFILGWDGLDSAAWGNLPVKSIAVDNNGYVFASIHGTHFIRKFNSNGTSLAKYGSEGTGPGQFSSPEGIEFYQNNIYICEQGNRRVQILTNDFKFISLWPADTCFDIAIDNNGNFFVTRTYQSPPTVFFQNIHDSTCLKWGKESYTAGGFQSPSGIAISEFGDVFIADDHRRVIVKFKR